MTDPSSETTLLPETTTATTTHYQVLGLTLQHVQDQKDPSLLIKKAYHRALLRHHPDKKVPDTRTRQSPVVGLCPSSVASPATATVFTVDRISEAFHVLSAPTTRAAYDRECKRSQQSAHVVGQKEDFQTGVDDVDLDDLNYDEAGGYWFKRCRCGNETGFHFTETVLEDAGDAGELLVGCQDCSLWIRVHFAVLE